MARMDQPEVDIINVGPHDNYRPPSPRRDRSEERSPKRSSRRVDDELSRGFRRLSINGKKDKDRNRRKSLSSQSGKITRQRSSSGGKQKPQCLELYKFEKTGKDWTVADRIRINAPQDELENKIVRRKSRIPVVDTMIKMPSIRRGQINRLLNAKNNDERDKDAEWVPVLIERESGRGGSVLSMDVIIAKTFKPGGSGPPEKQSSFVGEKSDLRVPLKSKGGDNSKDKDKFNEIKWNDRDRDQYREHDLFAEERFFANDGRPIDDQGRPFDGRKGDRGPIPLEDPIAGPIQALQPPRQAPGGWTDLPPPPGPFPHNDHQNQPPIEVINGGQPGDCMVDLEQLLDPNGGGGGGGGGHANQNFEEPRLNGFAGAGEGGVAPLDGASRRRSSEGRRRSGSRPRPTRIYTDRGPSRKFYRRTDHYGDSSIDDPDEVSIFFHSEDGSSISSYSADHERFIERRGSLKRRPSDRRGEHYYREHRRRPASYYPSHSDMILESARTPRRPRMERRQTIAYPVSRQITYPHEGGRRRDSIDEPLSPVLMQHGDSSGFSRRKDSRDPLPELYYPHELGGKDRAPDDYVDHMARENRFREDDWRRQERAFAERDAMKRRGSSKGYYYRDTRDGWDGR
jgi:hypothetical protein